MQPNGVRIRIGRTMNGVKEDYEKENCSEIFVGVRLYIYLLVGFFGHVVYVLLHDVTSSLGMR